MDRAPRGLSRRSATARARILCRVAVERIVVGAGAAGLWCAARSAERGARVLVLEKTPRTGTKVLASGGTRCNLTTTLGPDQAAALFGPRAERFLRPALRALPPRAVRERFERLGVPSVEAPLEKVFPASQRARDVRDALERWARGAGAEIRLASPVVAVERADAREARWRVRCADGAAHEARELVLATGGASVPKSGTTGEGYAWLAALGLPVVAPVPALVPLVSPAPWVHALTGIALQEVEARLLAPGGRALGRRARPVVFTHRGISGPGAMDLSEPVARAARDAREAGAAPPVFALALDLAPALEREALRARLLEAAARPGRPRLWRAVSELGPEPLPRRLVEALLARAGVPDPERPAAELRRDERHALVETLKGLAVPVHDTLGFDAAEVTAGGLALDALDPRSLRVNALPGLFVIGELLDRAGPIGGLNFQAAFAEAELAALAAGAPAP